MAIPTPVNSQITDSVSQQTLASLGVTPATAVASALRAMAHAASLEMLGAVAAQQNWATVIQAASARAASEVLAGGGLVEVHEIVAPSADESPTGAPE